MKHHDDLLLPAEHEIARRVAFAYAKPDFDRQADIQQELLLWMYANIKKVEGYRTPGRADLLPYKLGQVAKNLYRQETRQRGITRQDNVAAAYTDDIIKKTLPYLFTDNVFTPGSDAGVLLADVGAAFGELKKLYRAVLVARYSDDLTFQVIGDRATGTDKPYTEGTARNYHRQAINLMRQKLAGYPARNYWPGQ